MGILRGRDEHKPSHHRLKIFVLIAMVLMAVESRAGSPVAEPLIGYTELRTDLPGGRHANVATMRAMVVGLDGTGRRPIAEGLSREPDSWTQFAGWSPDGRLAIVGRGWESLNNARWEEEHQQFRYNAEGWLYDMNLVDLASGRPRTSRRSTGSASTTPASSSGPATRRSSGSRRSSTATRTRSGWIATGRTSTT